MTFDNATIFSGSSIIFRIPAQLKETRLLDYSVHVLFDNLVFTETIAYQLELALFEAANNIVRYASLAKAKAQISMKFSVMSDRVADEVSYKRSNGRNILTLIKYFTR